MEEAKDLADIMLAPFEDADKENNMDQQNGSAIKWIGQNAQANMKKLASLRRNIDLDNEEDLLNGLMSESEHKSHDPNIATKADQLVFDYSEQSDDINL